MEEKKSASEKQLKAVKHAREHRKEAKEYNSEYAEMAMKQIASGAKLADVAYWFGTNLSNLRKWKKEHPEFKRALNRGAELTQAWLLAKGMQTAVEHKCIDKIITYTEDAEGNIVGKKQIKEIEKTIPSNPQLLIFLAGAMSRRLGDESWTTKQFTETKIEKNVNYRIVDGKKIVEHLDKLAGSWSKVIDAEFVEQPKLETSEGE